MKNIIKLCFVFAASSLMACGNSADEGSAADSSTTPATVDDNATTSTLAADDNNFVMEAAKGGMKEVAAGEAAQKKASNAATKEVADHMVQDHTAMNDKVKSLAATKNVTLPASLPQDEMNKVNEMNNLSGAKFDKAYLDEMVKDHEKTISLFENASNNAKDPDVKALATEALPKLKHHLEMVQNAQKKLSGKGGNKK